MIAELLAPDMLIALITLIFLEIILGVDNIIFISIVTNKLPKEKQAKARFIGLALALIFRIILLLAITWIIRLTTPIFTVPEFLFIKEAVPINVRDLILIAGGLFLLAKSASEIHHKVDIEEEENASIYTKLKKPSMSNVLIQIVLLDMVFSFDSILTAIGLIEIDPNSTQAVPTGVVAMIIAVVISIIVMMVFAGKISKFINGQPTLQILALSFLILIGVMLILDGFHVHVPKGYIYFSVAFALGIEVIKIQLRKKLKFKYKTE